MNKYYEMFINDNVDDSIINVNPNSLSYEDRFWHYVCLSCYYQKHNNKYMCKKSLSAACDLNYYYNAFIFYNAYGVLPKKYEKDMKKFEHPMNNSKLEELIKQVNKSEKKFDFKGFILYMLVTLLIIPLMLLLILVFHMDKTVAVVISVLALFIGQSVFSPINKQRKEMKQRKQEEIISKNEQNFFNYLNQLNFTFSDPRYIEMIRAKDEEQVKEIARLIKENKPLPDKKKKNKA